VIAAFTFGPSEDNAISLLIGTVISPLSAKSSNTGNTGHKRNTGKYRRATKIQEFTGFTEPLGSLTLYLQQLSP